MLNPMRLIERAVGVGASVAGSALDFGRNALGRTSRDEEGADAASEAGGAASTAPEAAGSAGRSEPKADITESVESVLSATSTVVVTNVAILTTVTDSAGA